MTVILMAVNLLGSKLTVKATVKTSEQGVKYAQI